MTKAERSTRVISSAVHSVAKLMIFLSLLVVSVSSFGQDRPSDVRSQPFPTAVHDEISAAMAAAATSLGAEDVDYEIFELDGVEPIRVLRAEASDRTVMVFHIMSTGGEVFATITGTSDEAEMRMWDSGADELVFSARGVERRVRLKGSGDSRGLRPASDSDISDSLACLVRASGVDFTGMSSSNLSSAISRAACSGSNGLAVFLTAASCLSVPPSPMSVVGCVAGLGQLISCGVANCAVRSCTVVSISVGDSVGGEYQSSCRSSHRQAYAKFYKFRLTRSSTVTIDLTSRADTYLYLLEGDGTSGRVLQSDDDGGPGVNSRIQRTLGAGTYTIEATTYASGQTGSFALSIR